MDRCTTLWHFPGHDRWFDEGVRASLAAMAAAGFTHVNWNADAGSSYLYADAEMGHAADMLAEAGLRGWAVHGSNGRNAVTEIGASARETRKDFLSPVPWQRAAGLELVRNRLAFAARIGAPVLVMHVDIAEPSFADREACETAFALLHGALDALSDDCHRLGVRLAVENLPGLSLARTTELLDRVLSRHAAEVVGFCFDSGHAHLVAPGDLSLPARFGRRLVTTHLHDNAGVRDDHLLPGDGTIDWPALVAALADTAVPQPLVFETPYAHFGRGYALGEAAFYARAAASIGRLEAALAASRGGR